MDSKYLKYVEVRKRIKNDIEKVWDSINIDSKTDKYRLTLFINSIKNIIAKLTPQAKGVPQDVNTALSLLTSKEELVEKATEITLQILAKNLSLEEIENRLHKNHEEK